MSILVLLTEQRYTILNENGVLNEQLRIGAKADSPHQETRLSRSDFPADSDSS
jgi:hypothetical protein